MTSRIRNGFSLVEVMVALGVGSILMFATMTMYNNQLKANNYTDFQIKTTQLRSSLVGQFLNSADNCKCLFAGATQFPTTGISKLAGVSPNKIGRYSFSTPGDCATASIIAPFVTTTGKDGVKATDIALEDIAPLGGGKYQGNLMVKVEATRPVLGPSQIGISIPVDISATPVGSQMAFDACSSTADSGPTATGMDYAPTATGSYGWQSVGLSGSGGGGTSSGSPSLYLGSLGGYPCGSLATVTLSSPDVESSSKAAVVSFYSGDSTGESPAFRVFTTSNAFVGAIGRAGRGGDGKGYGAGGEMIVPLNNKRFKVQNCRKSGKYATLYFTTKAVLN